MAKPIRKRVYAYQRQTIGAVVGRRQAITYRKKKSGAQEVTHQGQTVTHQGETVTHDN